MQRAMISHLLLTFLPACLMFVSISSFILRIIHHGPWQCEYISHTQILISYILSAIHNSFLFFVSSFHEYLILMIHCIRTLRIFTCLQIQQKIEAVHTKDLQTVIEMGWKEAECHLILFSNILKLFCFPSECHFYWNSPDINITVDSYINMLPHNEIWLS